MSGLIAIRVRRRNFDPGVHSPMVSKRDNLHDTESDTTAEFVPEATSDIN